MLSTAYENFRNAGREHLEEEIQRLTGQHLDIKRTSEKSQSEEMQKMIKKEQKKQKIQENRLRMAQMFTGRTGTCQGPRETRMRAKLTAKLAQRARLNFELLEKESIAHSKSKIEKEALRAKLEEDARQAQEAMEITRAQREKLEERLKMFQEKLAKEQAALECAERVQKAEKERMKREQEEILATYEILRFAELRRLRDRYLENEKKLEILSQQEKLEEVKEEEITVEVSGTVSSSEESDDFEVSDDPFEDEMMTEENGEEEEEEEEEKEEMRLVEMTNPEKLQKIFKRETCAERALKERVLRRLKLKLDKRRMARQNELLEVSDLKNPRIEEPEDFGRADEEDRMRRMQYLRGGYRRDF
ncbi:Protein CBG26999 [Caenorhabditis briggsae]|uniref:Protein CBG26999 n=1 Tax=Caenorhabditis briggsae TaxID=6238 RepID=B6IIF6_CAEBR|nr:Protein CBG26999 [Caenorhabditis briggsae]CAR99686.1 Protein CBG26999 [Caenorhabditis briggsae]